MRIAAKHVRFTAEKTISIEAGPVRLRVDPNGVLRLEGEKMVIDMGALGTPRWAVTWRRAAAA